MYAYIYIRHNQLILLTVNNISLTKMRWYFVRIIKRSHYVYKRVFDRLNLLLRFIKLQQKSYLILLLLLASSTGYGSCKMVCYVIIYVFVNVNCYFVNTSKKEKETYSTLEWYNILHEVYLNWAKSNFSRVALIYIIMLSIRRLEKKKNFLVQLPLTCVLTV